MFRTKIVPPAVNRPPARHGLDNTPCSPRLRDKKGLHPPELLVDAMQEVRKQLVRAKVHPLYTEEEGPRNAPLTTGSIEQCWTLVVKPQKKQCHMQKWQPDWVKQIWTKQRDNCLTDSTFKNIKNLDLDTATSRQFSLPRHSSKQDPWLYTLSSLWLGHKKDAE